MGNDKIQSQIEKSLKKLVSKARIGNGRVEAGDRQGKLTLLKIVRQTPKSGDWIWRCICDCGSRVNRTQRYLINNANKGIESNCGCWQKDVRRFARCPKCKTDHYTRQDYDNWCKDCRLRAPIRDRIKAELEEGEGKEPLTCSNCQVKHFKDYKDGFDYCIQCRKTGKIRKIIPLKARKKEIQDINTVDDVKSLRIPNQFLKTMTSKELTEKFLSDWEDLKNEKISEDIAAAIKLRVILAYHER
jgi:hypothetical protein